MEGFGGCLGVVFLASKHAEVGGKMYAGFEQEDNGRGIQVLLIFAVLSEVEKTALLPMQPHDSEDPNPEP